MPTVLHRRAKLAILQKRPPAALAFLAEALTLIRSVRRNRTARRIEAEILESLGEHQLSLGRRDEGVGNLREAMRFREAVDQPDHAKRLADRLNALD